MRGHGKLFHALTVAAIRDQAKPGTGISWMRTAHQIRNLPEVRR